jgi:hypothetical protein
MDMGFPEHDSLEFFFEQIFNRDKTFFIESDRKPESIKIGVIDPKGTIIKVIESDTNSKLLLHNQKQIEIEAHAKKVLEKTLEKKAQDEIIKQQVVKHASEKLQKKTELLTKQEELIEKRKNIIETSKKKIIELENALLKSLIPIEQEKLLKSLKNAQKSLEKKEHLYAQAIRNYTKKTMVCEKIKTRFGLDCPTPKRVCV